MLKKIACIGLGVMIVITLNACGEKTEINEHNKENDFVVTNNNSVENKKIDVETQVSKEMETTDSNSENGNILDGRYRVPNSDSMWAFSKIGKAVQSGNVHVNFGTYKTTKENIIEIHYTINKFWNDDNVEISDINLYEYISVDNDNLYIMDSDGRKNKLERYGDVTEDDFSFEIVSDSSETNNDNKKIIKVTKEDVLNKFDDVTYRPITYSHLSEQLKHPFYLTKGVELKSDYTYIVDINGDGNSEEIRIKENNLYVNNQVCKPDNDYFSGWTNCFIIDLDRNDKNLELVLEGVTDIGTYDFFTYDGNVVKYIGEFQGTVIDGYGNIVDFYDMVMGINDILTGYYKLTENGMERRDIEYDKNVEHTAGKLMFSENIEEIKQCIDYIYGSREGKKFESYRENTEVLEEGTIFKLLDVFGENGHYAIPFVKLQDGREGYALDYYAVEDVVRHK